RSTQRARTERTRRSAIGEPSARSSESLDDEVACVADLRSDGAPRVILRGRPAASRDGAPARLAESGEGLRKSRDGACDPVRVDACAHRRSSTEAAPPRVLGIVVAELVFKRG